MKRTLKLSMFLVLVGLLLVIGACSQGPQSSTEGSTASPTKSEQVSDSGRTIPDSIVWSTYPVGGSGYIQAEAIGNAMDKYDGVKLKLRNIPASGDAGRLQMLITDGADIGMWGGNSVFMIRRGMGEFSNQQWGPQPLRQLWGINAEFGITLATAADANIETPYDLKGKRVAYIPGSPGANLVMESILAYADLTWDDVNVIEFPGLVQAQEGMVNGLVDASVGGTTSTVLQNLEASPRGVYFPEFPKSDEEAWKRMLQVAPFVISVEAIPPVGGYTTQQEILAYPYPVLAGLDGLNEDLTYAMTKIIHETFNLYKDAHPELLQYELDKAITVGNMVAPFYQGSIEYFTEIGKWNDELEARHQELLEEEKKIMSLWEEALAESEGMSDEEFAELWEGKQQ